MKNNVLDLNKTKKKPLFKFNKKMLKNFKIKWKFFCQALLHPWFIPDGDFLLIFFSTFPQKCENVEMCLRRCQWLGRDGVSDAPKRKVLLEDVARH